MQIGTPSTVEAALLFLYGKRPKVTDDNVGQLLQLAEFLLISNLKRHCFQWLKSRNVNSKNCIDICEMCSLYEFEIESCSQYVLAHLTELFNDDKMLKITNDTLTYILQDETLSYVSTEERFDFIIKWVAYSPGRQPYFEQLFNLVDPTGFSEEFLESRVLCSPFVNSSTTCMEKLANCQGSSTGDQLTDVLVPYPLTSTYSRDRVIECLDPIEHKWYQLPSQPGAVKASKSASVYDNSTIYALNEYENKLQIINIDKEMHVECKEKKLQYADNTVDLPRINVKHVVVVADKCFLVSSCQRELIKSTTNKEHNVAEYVDDPTQLVELVKLRLLGVDPMLTRQLLVNQISNTRCVYVDTTTVYAQSGEDDENMYIHPFFTVKYDVHAVCSSTNGGICLLGDGQVSVFNTVTNILDTIDTHSFSLNEGKPTLSPTSNGFMVHSGPDAIQVTPIQGPALVDRWKLRKIRIDSSEEKFNVCFHSMTTCVRPNNIYFVQVTCRENVRSAGR
ncbi:MAG: BTB/POZ domain-containing protein [Sedimenticola sp.]